MHVLYQMRTSLYFIHSRSTNTTAGKDPEVFSSDPGQTDPHSFATSHRWPSKPSSRHKHPAGSIHEPDLSRYPRPPCMTVFTTPSDQIQRPRRTITHVGCAILRIPKQYKIPAWREKSRKFIARRVIFLRGWYLTSP